MKRHVHRLGRVPRVPWARRMCSRTKAANLLRNVLRAVRSGNCRRAEIIMGDYEYEQTVSCVDRETMKQLHRKVQSCRSRRAA